MVLARKKGSIVKIFQYSIFLILTALILTGCGTLKGKTTVKNDPIAEIKDLPDKEPGVDLVEIQTAGGYIVEVTRSSIPKDENGNPYWPVADVLPNETIQGAADGVSWIPGYGTLIGGALSSILAYTTLNQRKQKQAEIDRAIKGESDLKLRDKLLIAAAVGVEVGTTDKTIKGEIAKRMTKKEQELFDDITEEKRIEAIA